MAKQKKLYLAISAIATFLAIVCLINAAILEYRKSRE